MICPCGMPAIVSIELRFSASPNYSIQILVLKLRPHKYIANKIKRWPISLSLSLSLSLSQMWDTHKHTDTQFN